jgi:hypothetical protein
MQFAARERRAARAAAVLAALIAFVAVAAAPVAAQMPSTGRVIVVHGLRGRLVDVYLDDALALEAFEPDRLTDPLDVPAGDHQVDLREPGTEPDSEPFASATVTVIGGSEQSVLAHLSSDGEPMISEYQNPVTAVAAGQSDVLVRHGAAAPPIDVLFGGDEVVRDLANPDEAHTQVAAAGYEVTVEDASGDTLVPANPVDLESASRMILYLVGSAEDDSLKWLAQPTELPIAGQPLPQSVPTAVAAGNSGLASHGRAVPVLVVLVLSGLLVVTAPRRRRG